MVFLIAIAVVAFFVLALSLGLILRGRHPESEIGDNRHMRSRGIECAARQMRREENEFRSPGGDPLRGECSLPREGCPEEGCGSCGTPG